MREKLVKKQGGQIQVNIPKDNRLEAIFSISSSNQMLAQAQIEIAKSNKMLAEALKISPQITITGCTVIGNGSFDTGIRIDRESDYEHHVFSEEDEDALGNSEDLTEEEQNPEDNPEEIDE